jgi:hypothetical protein
MAFLEYVDIHKEPLEKGVNKLYEQIQRDS